MIKLKQLFALVLVTTSCSLLASTVTIPYTFTANTPAVAADVNENFNAVKVSVDDNNADIADLMNLIVQMQNDINDLQSDLTTANNKIATLESNTVLQLDGYLSLGSYDDVHNYVTAVFSGINVQINNGLNHTVGLSHTLNGLGNLIIGYNESTGTQEYCSSPFYDNMIDCDASASGVWGKNIHRGSHNLVLGDGNSYNNSAGIIAGYNNVSNNNYSSVLGGFNNLASGSRSIVVGGKNNSALGQFAGPDLTIVLGGVGNKANGVYSVIVGGEGNESSGYTSTVSGGFEGNSRGEFSSVSGGDNNQAIGDYSSVSGGSFRAANGDYDWRAGNLSSDF